MAQQEYIKHLYEEEEKNISEIARIMGVDWRTAEKYATKEDWNEEKLPNLVAESYPILGPYIATLDEWLEADKRAPRKQRHTAKRAYDRLREEKGYKGSYSSVRRYFNKKKRAMKLISEGYLPLAQPEGEGQVDFGEVMYYDSQGREHQGYSLTVSFPYSNKGYTQAFPSQNQECLLEGMKRIFEHIGGVPVRLRFDNMSTAVVHVLEGKERVLTEGFRRFMLHYRFQADFCNPAAGNEKGNVENKVGYSRRNFFVPVPGISSFEEYNEELLERCEKDAERKHYKHEETIQELWEKEREKLLTLPPHPYQVFRYITLAVNKYGFATIETNKYALSPELSGKVVQAKVWFDRVEFFYDHQPVGEYRRSYGHNEEVMDWTQYTSVLAKKPGAVEHTRFFRQMPEQWQLLLSRSQGKERRNALQLLSEIVRDGNAELCEEALALASENGRTDADSIRQCYYMISKKEFHPRPLTLQSDAPELRNNPNLSAYDGLMGGEEHG